MIPNTTKKDIIKSFERVDVAPKKTFPWNEWWNRNENGNRCLLCYEPMEENDKLPDGGFPTFILYINGIRRVGAVHQECYAATCHQMMLLIEKHSKSFEKKCGKKHIDQLFNLWV